MNKILFLCSRNICSGRVAHELFNHYASGAKQGIRWLPDWVADSRGFDVAPGGIQSANEILSENAIDYLNTQQFAFDRKREPLLVEASDLLWADKIIALFEPDHRKKIETRFALWSDRVEYWNVPEFHEANWGKSLPKLEANVAELISVIRAEEIVSSY